MDMMIIMITAIYAWNIKMIYNKWNMWCVYICNKNKPLECVILEWCIAKCSYTKQLEDVAY